jgi:hypothetical protein
MFAIVEAGLSTTDTKSASIFRAAVHNHGIVRFGNLGFPLAGVSRWQAPALFRHATVVGEAHVSNPLTR